MKEKVLTFNEQHKLFNKGDTLFLAVSGGPDSLALLHFFASIKSAWDLQLHTLTVDHQLRGQASEEDAHFVCQTSEQLGIPCTIGTVDVMKLRKEKNIGTQEAARELRYRFFLEQMNKKQKARLVLAHHLDDQVELIVMQFVKGVRQKGMPVKRPIGDHYLIRPFFCLSKDEIIDYLNEHHLTPRIDESNEDLTYTRNRFRKAIIPLLKKENPNLNESIVSVANQLEEEEHLLNEIAEKRLNKIASFFEHKVTFSISAFTEFPSTLQRRAFHLILNYLQFDNKYNKDYFFSFLEWIMSDKPNSEWTFNNVTAIKSYDKCEIIKGKLMKMSYEEKLHVDDEIELPNGWLIKLRQLNNLEETNIDQQHAFICNKDELKFPLTVRTRKDGDRIQPLGLDGTKKVKKVFIDHKIPVHKRGQWPIILNGNGEIIWIPFVCKSKIASSRGQSNIIITVDTARD